MSDTLITQEIQAAKQAFAQAFDEAEQALKSFELESLKGLVFPAVNELRYAGRHLVRSLNEDSPKEQLKQIESGAGHARRAIYDVYDAKTLYYFEQCIKFEEDYAKVLSFFNTADFKQDREALQKIKEDLAAISREARETYLEKVKDYSESVKKIYVKWNEHRKELNNFIFLEREKGMRHRLAIITIIIGIPSALYAIFNITKLFSPQ